MNKHKRKRLSIDYLDRCIDGAAKHASKNEAEISRLQDRVKALETWIQAHTIIDPERGSRFRCQHEVAGGP